MVIPAPAFLIRSLSVSAVEVERSLVDGRPGAAFVENAWVVFTDRAAAMIKTVMEEKSFILN